MINSSPVLFLSNECNDLGHWVKFSLRDCRRAFGQRYIDHDAAMADVSHLMGHKTTRTTETYYCRKTDDDVFRNVKGMW